MSKYNIVSAIAGLLFSVIIFIFFVFEISFDIINGIKLLQKSRRKV